MPQATLITAADMPRLATAYDAWRSGMSLEVIAQQYGFTPTELEQLTHTKEWLEIQKERANFRAGKLVDQIHDVGETVMATARKLNARISEVLDPVVNEAGDPVRMAPADLKDAADALKSVAATAKNLSEAVGASGEVVEQQNAFINYLHITDNPK